MTRHIRYPLAVIAIMTLGIIFCLDNIIKPVDAIPTNTETVQFIQYLDENTALEQIRNGNLDLYYYQIPSDRLEGAQSRQNLKVYESTGGSYSILVNPASDMSFDDNTTTTVATSTSPAAKESSQFNPFSIRDARFALNYLVDRNLIVNELMGGHGIPMVSNYGPFDPDYLTILNHIQRFQFQYNPKLADLLITNALIAHGAQKIDQRWMYNETPIKITIFIRSDDPIRKSIGEILGSELQKLGFDVIKDFGDLNKAFVVVYGSDPADLRWNLYTEGWAGRSAFVRYDPVGLAQMYAPWFSNMPGFNDPTYWNYKNSTLDTLTKKIYTGNFTSAKQRDHLIQNATIHGIHESVRVFLASKIDQYVANQNVRGIINDFGAGVPTRFTPINAQAIRDGEASDTLRIGVKQIYQGAWNPVRGLTDSYSTQIWNTLSDPIIFKHPFTGNTIPVRASWDVHTKGPHNKIPVLDGTIIWDPILQKWRDVVDTHATSKVVYQLRLNNWHNGQSMDIYDILYAVYFGVEWGTNTGNDDKTIDTEYTPQAAQVISTLVGIRPINETTIEVYTNYWHFDEAEIAGWAAVVWTNTPWEIHAAMEQAVLDGKTSFSRSTAASKNLGWHSLLVPTDSHMIKDYLIQFKNKGFVPPALLLETSSASTLSTLPNLEFLTSDPSISYAQKRYDASTTWISAKNHAVISNGPFYLESYSPESRTITVQATSDPTYPFPKGHWSEFEHVDLPKITKVDVPSIVPSYADGVDATAAADDDTAATSKKLNITVGTTGSTSAIQYFVGNTNQITYSDSIQINSHTLMLPIPSHALSIGTNNIQIFAISKDVLRPDFYSTSFVMTPNPTHLENQLTTNALDKKMEQENQFVIIIVTSVVLGSLLLSLLYLIQKRKKKRFVEVEEEK